MIPPPLAQLDDGGTLSAQGGTVHLTPGQQRVVRALLDVAPDPLSLPEFAYDLWPRGAPTETGRRRSVAVLRRQLGTVGLALRLRQGIGYSLERSLWSVDGETMSSTVCTRASTPR